MEEKTNRPTISATEQTHCIKCGSHLLCEEKEVMGAWVEVGAYCDNKECDRYLLLVV